MADLNKPKRPDLIEHDPFRIRFNLENPRGPDVEADKRLWHLVDSVRRYGILVPLLVKEVEGDDDHDYELIDGERRLLAARTVNLPAVPLYVIHEPLDAPSARERMFHIHHNREPWGAAEECYALKGLYRELVETFGTEDETALIDELVKRAGFNKRTARNRLQFLRWPADIKEQVYAGEASYWFVVELEDKIVEPAQENFPTYFDRVPVDDVRRFLFDKWFEKGLVGAAETVRRAGIIARRRVPDEKQEEALEIFTQLVEEKTLGFEQAREMYLLRFPEAAAEETPTRGPRGLYNDITRLADMLSNYDEQHVVDGVGRSYVETELFLEALAELANAASELAERIREHQATATR